MFSVNHCIWMAIVSVLIVGSIIVLNKKKPSLEKVLTWCCIVAALSEVTKVFSALQLVPSADGTQMYLYMEMQHMPIHLCSIQIIFIFIARFCKRTPLWHTLLGFMYPTCMIGAFFALLLPSIFNTTIRVDQAFTHPMAYQTFLYHAMLIVLGYWIVRCGEVRLEKKHYWTTMGILEGLSFLSVYVNSMLATPVYESGKLISVEYVTNFFFTYKTPIGIKLTEMWHWYVYILILQVLAFGLIAALYIPIFKSSRERKQTNG